MTRLKTNEDNYRLSTDDGRRIATLEGEVEASLSSQERERLLNSVENDLRRAGIAPDVFPEGYAWEWVMGRDNKIRSRPEAFGPGKKIMPLDSDNRAIVRIECNANPQGVGAIDSMLKRLRSEWSCTQ